MKLSVDLGRWTSVKAPLLFAGLLAIGGAVGSAIAMSPTVAPPIKWAGGVEFANNSASGLDPSYTVPAGRNFILTDLIVGNRTSSGQGFQVLAGIGGTCVVSNTLRLAEIVVPPGDTAYVSLQTGVGFASGQAVCIFTTAAMSVSGRGFLFTPAPAS